MKEFLFVMLLVSLLLPSGESTAEGDPKMKPVILFDNDMGNDVDDALTLVMLLNAEKRGECKTLMVASSNYNPWAVPGIRALCKYYGREDIPVGGSSNTVGMAMGGYTELVAKEAGLSEDPGESSVKMMRRLLAGEADGSVRVVATGFSTNLAGLLESQANYQQDGIELSGMELIQKKVEFLSIMAGHYQDPNFPEFNVANNPPAFRLVMNQWPTPIYMSGFEVGLQVLSRGENLKKLLAADNPVLVAYQTYFREHVKNEEKMDRPSWDQTALLQALQPEKNHFSLSEPVEIHVSKEGHTLSVPAGKLLKERRYLKLDNAEHAQRIADLLEGWYSEPTP